MRKLLLILFICPLFVLAQQTYVPDDNFENYLEAHGIYLLEIETNEGVTNKKLILQ